MKETLYELTQKYKQAFENLIMDEETGEIINWSIIDNATDNFEEKCENVACYIKNLDALASAIKKEEEEQYKRRKSIENKIEQLKNYLGNCILETGKEKIETAKCKLNFRKSYSIEIIESIDNIDERFVKTKTEKYADKTAIKDAIKNGETFDFAKLVEKENLIIK